jgi:TPR repeat protein
MACNGDDERGCLAFGDMEIDLGKSKEDKARGKTYLDRGLGSLVTECDKENNFLSCASLGDFYLGRFTGKAPQKDKAKTYLEKACERGHDDGACSDLKSLGSKKPR